MIDLRQTEQLTSMAPDGIVYPIPSEREIERDFERTASTSARFRSQGRQIVVVQGLGFVGSAAAAVIASATDEDGQPLHYVIGVDLPEPNAYWKVAKLNDGHVPITSPDAALPMLVRQAVCERKNLCATSSEKAYSLADVIVVDIPLGVREPLTTTPSDIAIDTEGFQAGLRTIGRHMRPEALVLIETTVPIGITEDVVRRILREERARRRIDDPVCVAHSYERVMPGPNYVDSIRRYWRTFSAVDSASSEKARQFLASFIDVDSYPLCELADTNSSELAKLLENSYRAVNIAFIHEWVLLAERIGVDLFEVIDSIRVRRGSHDNMRLPGFGVGGYCLPKDPLLAQWSATHLFGCDVTLSMTLQALRINREMPLHAVDLLAELATYGLAGRTIAVCGVTYLPGVADTRYSPAETLVRALDDAGARVIAQDPCVTSWREMPDVEVRQDLANCLREADGVVFTVAHPEYPQIAAEVLRTRDSPPFIVDAQNAIDNGQAKLLHEAGCRLMGVGKGHWRKRGYQWIQ